MIKAGTEGAGICAKEKGAYEGSCAKSWVSLGFVFVMSRWLDMGLFVRWGEGWDEFASAYVSGCRS